MFFRISHADDVGLAMEDMLFWKQGEEDHWLHGYAREAVRTGEAQAVSFGRPFIGNPDLVDRIRLRAPLADYDPSKLYTPGPEGYIDYPVASAPDAL